MEKQKKYWLLGIAAAVIVLVLIVFAFVGNSQKNKTTDPHSGHSPSGNGQDQNTASEETQSPDAEVKQPEDTADNGQPETALNSYLLEQDRIMSDMMMNMEVEPSGNASVDFLVGMIPHHESAIDMSESYLKFGGENEQLKQLANDIISAQTGEIEQMNQLIQQITDSGEKDEEKEQGYLQAYAQMMSGHEHMHHGSSAAENVEQAFAEGMMMHHQMAVDMSEAILDYTEVEEVRQLAETIIKAQEEEIRLMQEILAQV